MSTPGFNTREIANPSDRAKHFKAITTNFPANDIPIGINMLETGSDFNTRIRAYIDNVSPADNSYHRFIGRINLDTSGDTLLYAAGCTWLDASKHSLDFQFGRFSGGEMKAMRAVLNKTIDIQFTRPYQIPPKVITWLTSLDCDCRSNTRFSAAAENITENGFTLKTSTWWDSAIHKPTTVSWVAVPSDNPIMTAGRVVAGAIGASSAFQEKIVFDRPFKRVPRVMVAFNKLDIGNHANLRIVTYPRDITTKGMTLAIDTWADTAIHGCAVGYIAIDDAPASSKDVFNPIGLEVADNGTWNFALLSRGLNVM